MKMARNADELKDQIQADLEAARETEANSGNTDDSTPNEPEQDTNPWAEIAEDFSEDDDYDDEPRSEEEPTTPPAEAPGEVTPSSEEAVPPEVPALTEPTVDNQPATPAEETPAAETQEEPETPPQQRATPEQIAEAKEKAIDELAQRYTLSDEEADDMVRNPEKAYPRFAAKLFVDVFEAVTTSLHKAIPQVVEQTQQQAKARTSAEESFYAANPLLDRTKHAETVNQFANMYVQMNPKATREQMIKDVGVQAMGSLGINPLTAQQQQQEQTPAMRPHVPAGAGHVTAQPVAPKQDNVWAQMADELIEDD
jgi:hypothetical protein